MCERTTGVVAGLLLSMMLACSEPAEAQAACKPDGFVATTVWHTDNEGDVLVLGTEARVLWFQRASQWRFRAIRAGRNQKKIDRVRLSADATYAEVRYSQEATIYVDLTQKLLQLPETAIEARAQSPRELSQNPEVTECASRPINDVDEKRLSSQLKAYMAAEDFLPSTPSPDWRFFNAKVDSKLYVPVLQILQNELIRPSAFEVWNELVPPAVAATRGATSKVTESLQRELFRLYQIRRPPCVIYTDRPKESSHGSWVVEYWFYYPFDVGGVGAHLHDSEHLFVEVDKLGGTVRRVAAAGHGMWAPNNIYHTYQPNAIPVSLPLFAIVEYGKHATAPDIDGDGWFTPGMDSNNYYDSAKVWGVRDTIGVTDSNMKPFTSAMMVKRERKNALVEKHLPTIFKPKTMAGLNNDNRCTLATLPETLPSEKCDGATAACARSQVGSHSDYKDPEKILKPALYPPLALRAAYTKIPTAEKSTLVIPTAQNTRRLERSDRVTTGVAFELAGLIGGLPGRAAVEAVVDVKSEDEHFNGIATRYEWLTSNLTGLYAGLSWINDDLGDRVNDEVNRAFWASGGFLFELPISGRLLDRRLTLQTAGGLMYNNYYNLAWDFRVGFAVTLFSPNRGFGIKRKVPNPY